MGGDGFKMARFFIDPADVCDRTITIFGEDAVHIGRVLRHKPGDILTLCDGNGLDYLVEIEKITANEVLTRIIEVKDNSTEPPVHITLFQGLPRADKMEFIIQKSVELGVGRIVPVLTERTVVRLDKPKDVENKLKRWQRISKEAAKQSNRGVIPEVSVPLGFGEALKLARETELAIIPYEKEEQNSLKQHIMSKCIRTVSVMIGPEGGFTEKEAEEASKCGIKPVTLGPRILRTETAGIAVLAMLMYELGDINGK